MAVCAHAVLQPDGSYHLGLDPSVTDLSTCAYVVDTGSDSSLNTLLSMSIDEAEIIGASIAALWAVMYGFRKLVDAVSVGDQSHQE